MADAPINVQQVQNAGDGYTVPASLDLVLKAARCSYDGSGAGGDFIPTLQILSDAGLVVAECPIAETVTAGASADVTWFPALIPPKPSTTGAGIQFDTDPQTGDWLVVKTTTSHAGVGMLINDSSAGGIDLEATSGTGALFLASNGADPGASAVLWATGAGAQLRGETGVLIQTETGPDGINIFSNGGSIRIVAPANQEVAISCSGATGAVTVHLQDAGCALTVLDSSDNPIFRVNENGYLQGLTGQVLDFNL